MKIVVLIESLTFGGAERQACVLAGEFKRRGHQVCVATYHRDDFYRSLLERENVEHCFLGGHGRFSWALNVRRFLRTNRQDVVLAFLVGPSAYAELAGFPKRSWGLVVSERSSGIASGRALKTDLHVLADYVITNSHSARAAIEKRLPRLRSKLVTIYNAVRTEERATWNEERKTSNEVRLIVPARLDRNKNPHGLLWALHALKASRPSLHVRVDWYGDQKAEPELLREMEKGILDKGLTGVFRLRPATGKIHDMMSQSDAVVLPSFYEGLPNAVCEGMALGKPILMSAVCDAGTLVQEGVNGFLFDPQSPGSIADAVGRFAELSREERIRMGRASRARAEKLFDVNAVVEHYLRILEASVARKSLSVDHWPRKVPADDHA